MKLIIANWKMNPQTAEEAVALAKAEDVSGLVICPPFPFLDAVRGAIRNAALGTQDFDPERAAGVRYAIIGHSDRRKLGETDEMVAKKVAAAVGVGITPVICIGEKREERASGESREVIKRQFEVALSKLINSSTHQLINLIVAYEPVWAISTEPNAEPDTPENAVQMIHYMKTLLATPYTLHPRFVYGGSVTKTNAASFLKEPEVEGALVGGASLRPEELAVIAGVASSH